MPTRSVRGYPIDVVSCGQGLGGVLVVGGMHGDERGSAVLVRELAIRHPCMTNGRALTIVPTLNPDGMVHAARENARGVDLNRNLPTRSWTPQETHGPTPISEPESSALYDLLRQTRPAFTLSVHEGNEALVDYDGPAEDAARVLGACTGLEVRRIGARPGSLGSLVGVDWGLPLVTLELPRWASRASAETLWAYYGRCLLAVVTDAGAEAQRAEGDSPTPGCERCPGTQRPGS